MSYFEESSHHFKANELEAAADRLRAQGDEVGAKWLEVNGNAHREAALNGVTEPNWVGELSVVSHTHDQAQLDYVAFMQHANAMPGDLGSTAQMERLVHTYGDLADVYRIQCNIAMANLIRERLDHEPNTVQPFDYFGKPAFRVQDEAAEFLITWTRPDAIDNQRGGPGGWEVQSRSNGEKTSYLDHERVDTLQEAVDQAANWQRRHS